MTILKQRRLEKQGVGLFVPIAVCGDAESLG